MERVGKCQDGRTGDRHSFNMRQPIPLNVSRTICWLAPTDGSFHSAPSCKGSSIDGRTMSLSLHRCGAQLWPPSKAVREGRVHPPHQLSLLTLRPACEPYGHLASETCFLSQGTESFQRKLQLCSLKTDSKFFIQGLILSGSSTLVLAAFLT